MANEGIEVIQANNRRVAAAKKAAAGTERNLQAAKKAEDMAQEALDAAQKVVEAANKGLEAAKKTVDTAKKTIQVATKEHAEAAEELKDAEKSQEAAQKKWEVVDLVEEDEEKPKSSSGSKKRVGLSSSEANATKKVRSDSNVPEEVLVEGCRLAEVNGIYKRIVDYDGSPQYSKEGRYKGEDVKFQINRLNRWYIEVRRKNGRILTCYTNENDSPVPPSDGWTKRTHGRIQHLRSLESTISFEQLLVRSVRMLE
eukprot:scaffold26080_cov43-Cyclotella_meneghiniana.AAC.8